MNTPILFLLGAVALSALGGIVVWVASRPRPEKFGSSIETFNRDLDALKPPGVKATPHRPTRPTATQAGAGSKTGQQRPSPTQPQPATAQARPKPGPRPRS